MTTAQRPAWRRPRLRAPGAQGKSCVRATSKKTTCPPSLKGPVGACERHKTARARARSVATRACCAIVLAGHWPCWACASAGRGAGRRGTAGLGWGSSGVTAREARPPLARDIDRADPKSRRWMCAYLNDGHDYRLFGPLGVDGLSSLVGVFGSQADGHIELKILGSAA